MKQLTFGDIMSCIDIYRLNYNLTQKDIEDAVVVINDNKSKGFPFEAVYANEVEIGKTNDGRKAIIIYYKTNQ